MPSVKPAFTAILLSLLNFFSPFSIDASAQNPTRGVNNV